MKPPYLQVIAHYFAKPGQSERVLTLLDALARATRDEPKNLDYQFFRSPHDPDHFVILEQYTDATGLDEHRQTPHFQQIGYGQIIPMLERREVRSHMVHGASQ
ncbi:antibiotic biosynthesis monooxygenase [Mycetohabitans endofungorum]|uniref:putative quinol monooxygenase n=1 Tax=Mycetohabitans endofungorum TaxID=417203 RepID=UPI0030D30B92